jgi:hypothetical protein
MAYVNCNDPDAPACLDALIKEINDDLTIGCQIPFTVPKNELARIINRAKDYFYKIYEDSVEEMYIALPASALKNINFNSGINESNDTLSSANINSLRGVVPMPSTVYSVNNVFELNGFAGEDGGFGSTSFSAGDPDFSIDKFIYSDAYGAGIGSENLMYYVINSSFIDTARQILLPQISYSYNRLTKKFRFQGKLPKHTCVFQVYSTIPDCNLFQDEIFIRYCIGKAKMQLARILGTFSFNLPGNITINYDMIASEGKEEIDSIIEEIKGDEGVDYFYTG